MGEAKNVSVSKKGQHWFISIQVEIELEQYPSTLQSSIVGGDLGIAGFFNPFK